MKKDVLELPIPSPSAVLRAAPVLFLIMILLGIGTTLLRARADAGRQSLPVLGRVPAFELTDRTGKIVTNRDLAGHPWIADFVFTSCAEQCPMMTGRMAGLADRIAGVRFVSFSVDPGRDTPEALDKYAVTAGARAGQWFFLTGARETIDRVAKVFAVNGTGEPAFHSASFVLVDAAGRIRGYYSAIDDEKLAQLETDARKLAPTGERI